MWTTHTRTVSFTSFSIQVFICAPNIVIIIIIIIERLLYIFYGPLLSCWNFITDNAVCVQNKSTTLLDLPFSPFSISLSFLHSWWPYIPTQVYAFYTPSSPTPNIWTKYRDRDSGAQKEKGKSKSDPLTLSLSPSFSQIRNRFDKFSINQIQCGRCSNSWRFFHWGKYVFSRCTPIKYDFYWLHRTVSFVAQWQSLLWRLLSLFQWYWNEAYANRIVNIGGNIQFSSAKRDRRFALLI